jgi:hypothetical protein
MFSNKVYAPSQITEMYGCCGGFYFAMSGRNVYVQTERLKVLRLRLIDNWVTAL